MNQEEYRAILAKYAPDYRKIRPVGETIIKEREMHPNAYAELRGLIDNQIWPERDMDQDFKIWFDGLPPNPRWQIPLPTPNTVNREKHMNNIPELLEQLFSNDKFTFGGSTEGVLAEALKEQGDLARKELLEVVQENLKHAAKLHRERAAMAKCTKESIERLRKQLRQEASERDAINDLLNLEDITEEQKIRILSCRALWTSGYIGSPEIREYFGFDVEPGKFFNTGDVLKLAKTHWVKTQED